MKERANIPSSAACGQWETLLTDALDGLLRPEDEATFAAHMAHCEACAALFEEARRGREWLEFLEPEPEVPAGLMEKILAETGPGKVAGERLAGSAGAMLPEFAAWQRPGMMASVRRFAEPRLMMTAAMAFFSIALTLNLTGVKLSSVRLSDLRPTAVRSYMERRLTTASTPIVRYYDHLRLSYEMESRMRELRRSTGKGEQPAEEPQNAAPATPGESKRAPEKRNGGSGTEMPEESAAPANNEMNDRMEISLRISKGPQAFERERSTRWIA